MATKEAELEAYRKGWTPIADGDVYCSPRCGMKCKRSWYDIAIEQALELAARMGPGWEPDVWENLGWHWRVKKGCCQIHPSENRNKGRGENGRYPIESYTCFFNSAHQFVTHGSTPEEALGLALQDARTMISRIREDCDHLSG